MQGSAPGPKGKARRLLLEARAALLEHVGGAVQPALQRAREALFDRAEETRDTSLKSDLLAAASAIQRRGGHFGLALEQAIRDHCLDALKLPPRAEDETRDQDVALSLVDEAELEESLAVDRFVNRVEVRYTAELFRLNRRLTVLNAGRAVGGNNNPVGPAHVGRLLRRALPELELEGAERIAALKAMTREIIDRLGDCYEQIDELLVQADILPNLRFDREWSRGSDDTGAADGEAREDGAAESVPPADAATLTREVHAESEAVLGQIRALMERMRGGSDRPAPGPVVSPQEIGMGLRDLQRQHAREGAPRLDTATIKAELARWLEGRGMNLGPEQEQTIDLMGMVYDYLRQELHVASAVQNLFERLQLPLLRAAVQDESFFSDQSHPARQFFNTVADASELWLEDTPENSPIFQRMRDAVSGISQDFDDDVGVFKERLEELRRHIALTVRKAQLAERRQVEARKGREKLAVARARATAVTEQLIGRYDPPDFARTLVEEPWRDYLALVHLRHGEEGPQWEQAVMTAKFIAVALHGRLSPGLAEQLHKRLPTLTRHLGDGLAQVGYSPAEVEDVVERVDRALLWGLEHRPGDPPPEEFEDPMPAPAARSEVSREPDPPAAAPEPEARLGEGERQELARLRLVPFGTWFEIDRAAGGPAVKRKLSWFSPVSGTALLTDSKGQGEEMKLVDLARLVHRGQARRFDPGGRPLLDRALNAVLSRLRKLAGSPA